MHELPGLECHKQVPKLIPYIADTMSLGWQSLVVAVPAPAPAPGLVRMFHSCCIQNQGMRMKVRVELMVGWMRNNSSCSNSEEDAHGHGSFSSFSFWTTT